MGDNLKHTIRIRLPCLQVLSENKRKLYACTKFCVDSVAMPSVEIIASILIMKNYPHIGIHKIHLKEIALF